MYGAMKLHTFLFGQLWNEGVRQIFGIPGDFVLNLYEALEDDGRFQLIRLSHEPAVGFAADGAARITAGLGVCCVTYGAGGLNMINPVACAYAEESPLVILSGGPGRLEKRAEVHVHHEVKSFESQLKVYQEVTEFAAILDDPRTVASQIRKAIEVALKVKPVDHFELKVDAAAADEAAEEIIARLTAAKRPVLLVGVEVHRFQLRDQVIALAERLNVPVASSFLGRGVFPTRHPQFIGTYLGVASPPALRERVEQSDCVLLLGELISDTWLGVSATRLGDANLLIAVARDVYIRHHRYQNTPLDHLVARLLASPDLPSKPGGPEAAASQLSPEILKPMSDDEPIKVRHVIGVLNDFLAGHQDLPIVADTGDCLFASVDVRADEFIAPAYYATMGFAIPAALGVQIASGRRPLVLVGDGAFQMTGAEIAHATEYHCNPIIVLFNNSRWEMLQVFFPDAGYNDTVAWPYAKIAELWGGRGFDVRTPRQLRDALAAATREDRFTLIEVQLQRGDVSPILRGFVSAFKQQVYSS
jgi:indolepyruvate decarboxylase